jgi:hypothetical protein
MKRLGLVSVLGLVVLGASSPTLAEPPGNDATRARTLEQRAERAAERLRQLAVPGPSASAPPAGSAPTLPAAPSGSVVPGAAHLADLARRWKALGENRVERRERSRAALVRQLGPRLSDPRVKDELKLHATRVAELTRLRFLAENARSGATRQQLLARIAKLSAREAQRHEKQLAKLAAAAGVPSAGVPVPSAVPAPSGAKP